MLRVAKPVCGASATFSANWLKKRGARARFLRADAASTAVNPPPCITEASPQGRRTRKHSTVPLGATGGNAQLTHAAFMITATHVAALCRRQDGIGFTHELLAAGASRFSLREAVRIGEIERLRAGVFVVPEVGQAQRQALMHGGVLCCVSAAQAAGLWVMPFEGVHVWLTASGHQRWHDACRCVAHWHETPTFRAKRAVLGMQTVLRQIAQCQGREGFFVALESALNQRKVSSRDLVGLQASLPRSFAGLFELAQSTAESGLESLVRYRLAQHGIAVRGQVSIPGVGRVDLVVGDCLIIEADGTENHVGSSKRHRDLVRDTAAAALGLRTLRFDYAMIVHDWPQVEAAILEALRAGAHVSVAGLRMRDETRRALV